MMAAWTSTFVAPASPAAARPAHDPPTSHARFRFDPRHGLGSCPELHERDLVAGGDEHGLHGHASVDLLRRAVEHLTHEMEALVHEDVDHVVGQRRLEGGG